MTNDQNDCSAKQGCRPGGCTAHSADAGRGARCDLHIHSKYSDRPSEWFLRRIGAPESFTEPAEVYRRCRAAGMDYVTISDHNCIRGAMEIADLPGVFISAELTTYFPEDRCKIHCLVSGITARQFDELQVLREDIYTLRAYLLENRIIHTIAHPLFRVNDRLTTAHVEKLLVLFNRFEGINGSRDPRACAIARAVLGALDANILARMADKHGLEPAGDRPWEKCITGGSDDHGGLYPAGAFTETPAAATVFDYLEHLRAGRHAPGGCGGSSLKLASSLMHIARQYLNERLTGGGNDTGLINVMLSNFAEQPMDTPASPVKAVARRLFAPMVKRHRLRQMSAAERMLVDDFMTISRQMEAPDEHALAHETRYDMVSRLAHAFSFLFVSRCAEKIKDGELMGAVQALASLGPVLIGVTPYLAAFSTQNKDRSFLKTLCETFPAGKPALRGTGGRAWITDTFHDINGVAKTIHKLAGLSHTAGKPITVLTSLDKPTPCSFPTVNFTPVGSFQMPAYSELTLPMPPILDIVRHIEQQDYESLIISTPGPMGLAGLLAGRLLNIPIRGIYHTDFPHYVETWTDDAAMGELTRQYMRWFYRRMETIFAPTQAYIETLVELGFERGRLAVLPRGVDLVEFNPDFRQAPFWPGYGLADAGFTYLYVGRVSSEKNIDIMLEAHRLLREQGCRIALAVVGDGPDLERLKAKYGGGGAVAFTGYLHGKMLATAYASADALVFPSMSDTFGNVVLEAHASGLPAVVSDKGGPQEIVRAFDSGIVADARSAASFAVAMRTLAEDTATFAQCRKQAFQSARAARWDAVLDIL